MSVRQFFDVVPKSVKTVAAVIAGGGVLIGLACTFIERRRSKCSFPCFVAGAGFGLLGACGDRNLDSLPGLRECRCSTPRHAAHSLDAHRSLHS